MKAPATARLKKIEEHLAHLERQFDELNAVVIDQGRRWKKLQAFQEKLSRTLETIELDRVKSTNPKPPHYR
jgi:uncharacterized coiled-coil protein SlyX